VPPTLDQIRLSIAQRTDEHGRLLRAVLVEFAPQFVPGAEVVCVSGPSRTEAYRDERLLAELGIAAIERTDMPDVLLYARERNALLLVIAESESESFDGNRVAELRSRFVGCSAALVSVVALPRRADFGAVVHEMPWEATVWMADEPLHVIHLDSGPCWGPYS
jgi:type II restriction enzyme